MGVYVRFPDGSGHWDESLPDPNPNGGSVIDSASGRVIPGAGRQSQSSGPGGNGVPGTQANPGGGYHAGPPVGGGVFGAGMFGSGGTPNGSNPMGPNGQTPFADWVTNMLGTNTPKAAAPAPQAAPAAPTAPGQPTPQQGSPANLSANDWFNAWAQRQQADYQSQVMARSMAGGQGPNPFVQSGIPEGSR